MKRAMMLLLLAGLLSGCQYPWHGRVKIDPGETKVDTKVVETPAPVSRKTKRFRVIIRPTSRPAVEEVPSE
ncbi:MAG TPA: hypothetical protein VMY35_16710 [Phycisphaerae bacterium]|nr:hypothetical protein [Phycisphaerae bacterium]